MARESGQLEGGPPEKKKKMGELLSKKKAGIEEGSSTSVSASLEG